MTKRILALFLLFTLLLNIVACKAGNNSQQNETTEEITKTTGDGENTSSDTDTKTPPEKVITKGIELHTYPDPYHVREYEKFKEDQKIAYDAISEALLDITANGIDPQKTYKMKERVSVFDYQLAYDIILANFTLECIAEVSEKLKGHPSNYRLLSYSLGGLFTAIAEQHACRISRNFIYTNSRSMLAYVKARKGDGKEAMKLRGEAIHSALVLLTHELCHLGNQYDGMGKHEEAYQCYALFPDIYDLIMKDREDDIPFYRNQSYDRLALTCMKLGRYDEAMEQLERYLRHEERVARTYNIVTESKIPYFYGGTLKYSHDHYTARGDISEVIGWSIFDPIRDTDRFRALAKEVSEFEEKYKE